MSQEKMSDVEAFFVLFRLIAGVVALASSSYRSIGAGIVFATVCAVMESSSWRDKK